MASIANMGKAINKATDYFRRFYAQETQRVYAAWEGDKSLLPMLSTPDVELSSGRIVAHIVLGPLSPVVWGTLFAFLAHNVRTAIEWMKSLLNTVYESGHEPVAPHQYHTSIGWQRAINLLSIPGMLIGMVLGAVGTGVWVNLSAMVYTAIGMGNLSLQGRFVHNAYDDHILPAARHIFGFPGTLAGFAIGLVPFLTIGLLKSIKHSTYSFYAVFVSSMRSMINLWTGNKESIDIHRTILSSGRTDKARSKYEAYGLGLPGLILGGVFGLIPAAAMLAVGTVVFFPKAFVFAFRDVYNTVVYQSWEIKIGVDYTITQRVTYGWLGTLIGATLAAGVTSAVFVLRTLTNSLRLFGNTAAGIINLTFTKPNNTWFGFHRENLDEKYRYRWLFGIPGTVLALIGVGIPCAVIIVGKNVLYVAAMAVSLIFTMPVRVIRQSYRYFSGDMLFSKKNRTAPPAIEAFMHDIFANAIDGNGELIPGEIHGLSQKEQDEPYYTFGFGKNFLKLFRKSLVFDMPSELEEMLKDILAGVRDEQKEINSSASAVNSQVLPRHLLRVVQAVRHSQEVENKAKLHTRFQIRQITEQMEVLGRVIIEGLMQLALEELGGERSPRGMYDDYMRMCSESRVEPIKCRDPSPEVNILQRLETEEDTAEEPNVRVLLPDVVVGVIAEREYYTPEWRDLFFAEPANGVVIEDNRNPHSCDI